MRRGRNSFTGQPINLYGVQGTCDLPLPASSLCLQLPCCEGHVCLYMKKQPPQTTRWALSHSAQDKGGITFLPEGSQPQETQAPSAPPYP